MTSLQQLNSQFGIDSTVTFCEGPNTIPVAKLTSEHGTATVALHGAHVLEYTPAGGRPVLWISDQAVFAQGKAIRGGIPVCWPWFGPHPSNKKFPAHGFARNLQWQVTETHAGSSPSIALQLKPSPETLAAFPHAFQLSIIVTLGESLTTALLAHNTGNQPMTCSAALHSYFSISNISDIKVSGLEGTRFRDQLDEDRIKTAQTPITFNQEVDRVYHDTAAECTIDDPGWGRKIHINKTGSRSTVVWNPWVAKAARMSDFGDTEFHDMVCVETTNADNDTITIAPGDKHLLSTQLSVSQL